MKLLSNSVIEKLQKQYPFGADLNRQDVVARLYDPCGPWRWYLLNQNPEHPDDLLAIFRGGNVEIVKVSLSQLEAFRGEHLGFPLDRDPYFLGMPAKEVWDKLQNGQDIETDEEEGDADDE